MEKNKYGEIVRIFPTSIYKAQLGLSKEDRDILSKEIYDQEKKSKNPFYTKQSSAWTGDTQGYEYLYLNLGNSYYRMGQLDQLQSVLYLK